MCGITSDHVDRRSSIVGVDWGRACRHGERVRDHTKLRVWQKGCDLVVGIYEVSGELPSSEKYGLSSQMQRAAVSIPSNIAEGASRRSKADFVRFLDYAAGSTGELDTQLHLSTRLGLVPPERVHPLHSEIASLRRMLGGLIRSATNDRPPKTIDD